MRGGISFTDTYSFVWPPFTAVDDDMVVKLRDLLSESTLKDIYEEGLLATNFTSLDDLGKVKALRTSIQYWVETFERLRVDEALALTVMKLVWKAQIKADAQWKLKAATTRTIAELMEAPGCHLRTGAFDYYDRAWVTARQHKGQDLSAWSAHVLDLAGTLEDGYLEPWQVARKIALSTSQEFHEQCQLAHGMLQDLVVYHKTDDMLLAQEKAVLTPDAVEQMIQSRRFQERVLALCVVVNLH